MGFVLTFPRFFESAKQRLSNSAHSTKTRTLDFERLFFPSLNSKFDVLGEAAKAADVFHQVLGLVINHDGPPNTNVLRFIGVS